MVARFHVLENERPIPKLLYSSRCSSSQKLISFESAPRIGVTMSLKKDCTPVSVFENEMKTSFGLLFSGKISNLFKIFPA